MIIFKIQIIMEPLMPANAKEILSPTVIVMKKIFQIFHLPLDRFIKSEVIKATLILMETVMARIFQILKSGNFIGHLYQTHQNIIFIQFIIDSMKWMEMGF